MTLERVHGHVRILREPTNDDFWDLVGLLCLALTTVALLRLALP